MAELRGQLRGRTVNGGKPRDIAEVEIYDLKDGKYVATGETLKVPANLYFVADEWCVVNDYALVEGGTEQRLCATEEIHGPGAE